MGEIRHLTTASFKASEGLRERLDATCTRASSSIPCAPYHQLASVEETYQLGLAR